MSAQELQPTVVCVLGMSRSGTSLTARVLNLCGVYLGPEDAFLPPLPANPQGFWEHFPIMRLNEEILTSLGGSWQEPPPMALGWEVSAQLDTARQTAIGLLERTFAGRPLWGWKDPRTCLTLPFWQSLVPQMRYVICLRNPVDVVASLERRDRLLVEHGHPSHGVDPGRGFGLWLTYVASAIVNTAGRPRVFVSYDEYFEDWPAPAERLARFLDLDHAALDAKPAAEIERTIDVGLRHHRTSAGGAMRDEGVPADVATLHRIATQLLDVPSHGPADGDLAPLHAAADLYARRLLASEG